MQTRKEPQFRRAIEDYIGNNAKPADKYSHQPRLYTLSCRLAEQQPFDDDALHAAAWLHDIGVFVGHRPEDPVALAKWDNLTYALEKVPSLLTQFDFPKEKIAAVLEVIRHHLPSGKPTSFEGILLRDADILEQMGAIGILRTVSKIGRDTRFIRFEDAIKVLQRNMNELADKLNLASAKRIAEQRKKVLQTFLEAANEESCSVEL